MSERVLVSWYSLLNSESTIRHVGGKLLMIELWTSSNQPAFVVFFQSPPKGESSNEENKEVSATPASEPSSQETTPEKGKDTNPTDYWKHVWYLAWLLEALRESVGSAPVITTEARDG